MKKHTIIYSFFSLFIGLMLLGCDADEKSPIDVTMKKVSDLFVDVDEEDIKEEITGTIKESTNKKHIDEALEVFHTIDATDEDEEQLVSALDLAILNAQLQLVEREIAKDEAHSDDQVDEELEPYEPGEEDIVLKNNQLTNKQAFVDFMENAGEKGKDNEREIRVVKDEGEKGVLIYDLQSRYDERAEQSWIDVYPDMSYYSTATDDTQDVFNSAPQQCNYIEKDETDGFYKIYECRTHWDYPLLPDVAGEEK